MADEKELFFKKNVNYVVGGRYNLKDWEGFLLTNEQPYVSIKPGQLRDFKIANKESLLEGLIVPAEEPSFDWETENAITDEEALELVKGNFLSLKKKVDLITSVSILAKMIEIAKEEDRPKKTLALLEARMAEIAEDDDFVTPAMMRGVE